MHRDRHQNHALHKRSRLALFVLGIGSILWLLAAPSLQAQGAVGQANAQDIVHSETVGVTRGTTLATAADLKATETALRNEIRWFLGTAVGIFLGTLAAILMLVRISIAQQKQISEATGMLRVIYEQRAVKSVVDEQLFGFGNQEVR